MSSPHDRVAYLERELVMANALLEAIAEALDGSEPSDFMLSFGAVRRAWEVAEMNRLLTAQVTK